MKQYLIDELRPHEHEQIKNYLDANFEPAELDGIYWIPLETRLLTPVQTEHTACQPFFLVLALEPMVNMGSYEVYFADDEWTVKTTDGLPSAHFEHSVAITNNGPDNATGVVVEDQLPSGYNYLSDNGLGAYDNLSGLWTIGALSATATETVPPLPGVAGYRCAVNLSRFEERSAGNPHATFCGSRRRVTASGDV